MAGISSNEPKKKKHKKKRARESVKERLQQQKMSKNRGNKKTDISYEYITYGAHIS